MHPRTHTFTLTHITSVNCSNLKINQGWRGAEGATVRWGGGVGGRVAKPLLAVVGFEQSIWCQSRSCLRLDSCNILPASRRLQHPTCIQTTVTSYLYSDSCNIQLQHFTYTQTPATSYLHPDTCNILPATETSTRYCLHLATYKILPASNRLLYPTYPQDRHLHHPAGIDRAICLVLSTLKQLHDQTNVSQTNTGTVSKATLGTFLREGVERIWAFPSA